MTFLERLFNYLRRSKNLILEAVSLFSLSDLIFFAGIGTKEYIAVFLIKEELFRFEKIRELNFFNPYPT